MSAVYSHLIHLALFILALGFNHLVSQRVDPQASMDAAYYSIVADRWLSGQGLTEPFIWHHLKPYTEIIRPIDYWQPLCAVIIAAARRVLGEPGPVFFNHLCWALLSVFIFQECRRRAGSWMAAGAGYAFFLFCGKYLFYVSTTDNIAVYALFGYALLRLLESDGAHEPGRVSWSHGLIGLVCGLMSLTRIDGVIFSALTVLILLRRRCFKVVGITLLILLVTLSPWIIRNLQVLGTPWTTSSRALFLQSYDDFFDRGKDLTWAGYSSRGWDWIIRTKLNGLQMNLVEFFLVPTHMILLPFWLAGLIMAGWRLSALHAGFTILFWFLNGVLFTAQSVRGTAFHVSAALFPHFAMLCGLGVSHFANLLAAKFRPALYSVICVGFIFYSLGFSLFALSAVRREYLAELAPYKLLVAQGLVDKEKAVLSSLPIQVHALTGALGVMLPSSGVKQADLIAREYGCRLILFDARAQSVPVASCTFPEWALRYASDPLYLWKDTR